MTHAYAKLINYKNNAQLVLSILKEEAENEKMTFIQCARYHLINVTFVMLKKITKQNN
jgi:hypothetical protein